MIRHAYCIFCDDIRFEIGNKPSFMGVYGGILSIPDFPAVLPKLCVLTYCSTSVQQRFQSLTIRISIGDTILSEIPMPEEVISRGQSEIIDQGSAQEPIEVITMGSSTILTPFVIENETILRVIVIADGEEITAGKLRMRKGLPPHP